MSQKSLSPQPAPENRAPSTRKNTNPQARRHKSQAQKAKAQAAKRRHADRKLDHPLASAPKTEEKKSRLPAAEIATQPSAPPSVVLPVAEKTPISPIEVGPGALQQKSAPEAPKSAIPPAKPVAGHMEPAFVAPVPPSQTATPKRRWPFWVGSGLLAFLLLIGGSAFGVYQTWQGGGCIAPNLFIAGQDVGGLTRDQALEKLKMRFGNLDINLVAPDQKWHLPVYSLGGVPDFNRSVNDAYWFGRTGSLLKNVPLIVKANFEERHLNLGMRWNKQKMKTRMRALAKEYQRPARNAQLQVNDANTSILPEIKGRTLNVGATLWHLQRRYSLHHNTIEAKVQEIEPRVAANDLSGADVKIGTFTTRFNRGLIGRTRNLHVASATINGKVLMPGDTFSFNASTGERTWEKGYRMAHIFERKPGKSESEVVDGLAGGVCQVSTTLYNAVRKGNQKVDSAFQIVQRESHSLPVPYISSGLDATVAWPNRDFKFKNTLSYPIYLRAAIDGSRLTISVWARMPHHAAAQFAQSNDQTEKKTRG